MPELTRTLCALIPQPERRTYQFAAILGDLLHKQDCYLAFGDYGVNVESYFTNESQAAWLRSNFPSLVPPSSQPDQPPSDHTLGTVFEFHYFSDLHFRLSYIAWFRTDLQCEKHCLGLPQGTVTVPTPLSAPRHPSTVQNATYHAANPSSVVSLSEGEDDFV
jgi:hypothetical protein